MKPTPESLAALRESAEMLGAVCDRAGKCDHLEARNKHLQGENDSLSARHGVLQAVIRKAVEGLVNTMPRCKGMGLPELVVESQAVDKLQGEILVLEDRRSSMLMEVDALRAENGRQAAVIAALRAGSELLPYP